MQVIQVDDVPSAPLQDIQSIVARFTDRSGDVIELTYEYEQPLSWTVAANARRPVGPWEEWSGMPEADDGD